MIRSSSQVQLLVISPGAKKVQEVAAFRIVLLQKFPEKNASKLDIVSYLCIQKPMWFIFLFSFCAT